MLWTLIATLKMQANRSKVQHIYQIVTMQPFFHQDLLFKHAIEIYLYSKLQTSSTCFTISDLLTNQRAQTYHFRVALLFIFH